MSRNTIQLFCVRKNVPNVTVMAPKVIHWVVAQDYPQADEFKHLSKEAIENKRRRWLQNHDQNTAGLTSLIPLYEGLRVRATDKLSKKTEPFEAPQRDRSCLDFG